MACLVRREREGDAGRLRYFLILLMLLQDDVVA